MARHGPMVWQTCYRLLNHREDAFDCYQETFFAAFRVAQAQPIDDWSSFLACLATRRAMDQLRKRYRSRRQSLSIDTIAELSGEVDGPIHVC
ncbi:MAG: sigma-70 family RNA polymerase sigma factor [Planctomycetes bacterium]|nr:sigma-70 family RNA polymerase sigma factor [Planctomycetota bacterium]